MAVYLGKRQGRGYCVIDRWKLCMPCHVQWFVWPLYLAGCNKPNFFSGGCPLVCSYRLTDSDQVPPANQGGLVPLIRGGGSATPPPHSKGVS